MCCSSRVSLPGDESTVGSGKAQTQCAAARAPGGAGRGRVHQSQGASETGAHHCHLVSIGETTSTIPQLLNAKMCYVRIVDIEDTVPSITNGFNEIKVSHSIIN